jgi:hypothetical protein
MFTIAGRVIWYVVSAAWLMALFIGLQFNFEKQA